MSQRSAEFVHLHNPYEFDKRFMEKAKECDTYEEAYHEVEKEHKSTFGTRKYSSYNSYRNARSRRIKQNQN